MEPTTPPNISLPLPQSTPIKMGTATMLPFTTNQKFRIPSCTAMAQEIKSYLLGPMPVEQFLNDFFPTQSLYLSEIPKFTPGCYDKVLNCTIEPLAYDPFVGYLIQIHHILLWLIVFKVKATKKFAPHLNFVNSSSYVDCNPRSKFSFGVKPDVTAYENTTDTKTNSATAEIFIEFKWNSTDDPFCDVMSSECSNCHQPHQTFLNSSNAAMDTLGQITSYAAAQLGAQFRTHAYSVLIVKDTARILRWDRSGTIVTEPIKYNNSPYLVEFFRRYSAAHSRMRGRDETVLIPTSRELRPVRRALDLDSAVPLVKVSVPGPDNSLLWFIIPTPETTPYTPPGRATRGFKAYDINKQQVVFLKDTWRIDVPGHAVEGSIYTMLNAAGVRNVPQCLASGDISTSEFHETKTSNYIHMPWACKGCCCHPNGPWIRHRHSRLILNVFGRALTNYTSSREMVSAIRDALYGEFL